MKGILSSINQEGEELYNIRHIQQTSSMLKQTFRAVNKLGTSSFAVKLDNM